jgi:CHAP domain
MLNRTLVLTSPHMHGPNVRDVQYLLAHNKFGNFRPGSLDGQYGPETAQAAKRAKWLLGYRKSEVNGTFGNRLLGYLEGKKGLTLAMRLRRKLRLKALQKRSSVKARALQIAEGEANKRVTEYPPGTNRNPYGRWYGFDGVPWCAEFVSYCFGHAGDKKGLKTALAFQWEYWGRAHARGLSITSSPQPGDIVVYHWGQGHTGIFKCWENQRLGTFWAVEGNTSSAGSQDNGGAVLVQPRNLHWAPTVFVRVGE